jgi:hypothetical protein
MVAVGLMTSQPGVDRARVVSRQGVREAQEWIAHREGHPSFAVIGRDGRMRGHDRMRTYPSASVSKAMLLVAVLRAADDRALTAEERSLLGPMITSSRNPPARQLYARYGPAALSAVARAAGMRRFGAASSVFESRICAADQARFFLRIDRLVPRRHRSYARRLLAGIVARQRWGIAPAARDAGLRLFFKGGWRPGLTHQVALLERTRRRRAALAVLTASPSKAYGKQTIEGVARRVLGR